MKDLSKRLLDAMNAQKQKETSSYDTTAEVIRVEGDIAYVHILGGVDETPIRKTIDCKVGDTVQVRVGGGSAWITGNATNPPTDDTVAIVAHGVATTAKDVAEEAQGTAERANIIATRTKRIADTTNQYFWVTEIGEDTGVHMTEHPQDEFTDPTSPNYHSGGNLLARSNGIAFRNGMEEISQFFNDRIEIGSLTGSNSLHLSADEVSFQTAEGASFFRTRATGTSVTSEAVVASGHKFDTINTSYSTTLVGNILSGANINVPNLEYVFLVSQYTSSTPVTATATSGDVRVSGMIVYWNAPDINFTYGSAETYTSVLTISSLDKDGKAYTISETITVDYDGDIHLSISQEYRRISGEGIGISLVTGGGVDDIVATITNATAPSFTLGVRNGNEGALSSAMGMGLYASQDYQTAIGKYNVDDTNDEYALIVGNGSDDSNRSNAFTVDWNGNANASGDVIDGNGNVLSDKADAASIPIDTIESGGNLFVGVNCPAVNNQVLTLPDETVVGGDLNLNGTLTVQGHAGAIGQSLVATGGTSGTTSVASGSSVAVASLALTAGVWVVFMRCVFPANASGFRAIGFSATSTDSTALVKVMASPSGTTSISAHIASNVLSYCDAG